MNFISKIKGAFGGTSTPVKSYVPEMKQKTNPYSDNSFFGSLGVKSSYAGVDVNYTSAMRHNDVYTCVRIKAESLGQLPIQLYRHNADRKTRITSGREYKIFTQKPNAYQTWQDFIEQYVASLEIQGNFYAEIKRNTYGNVYEIVPFRYQNNVSVEMDSYGRVYYTYSTNDGKGRVEKKTYAPSSILHVKLFTTDGYRGLSPITQCARAVGVAIASETTAATMFEKGAKPAGVLQTDEVFDDDDDSINRLRDQWQELYGGPDNSGKIAILESGLKFQSVSLSAVDSQLLEQRKFTREQISSIFRVPLHMLQAASGMKYASVEGNNKSFYKDALMPLAIKLQNAINEILPENHTIKMDEKEFVRGDRESHVKTVKEELTAGFISINEGRIELGYQPVEGGDVFAVQTNNLTFGRYDELPSVEEQMKSKNPSSPEPKPDAPPKESNNGT